MILRDTQIVRNTKPLSAYYASFFTKDNLYQIVAEVQYERTLIIDETNFFKKLRLVASAYKFLINGHTEETLPEVIDGYESLKDIYVKYTKKVTLPYYLIKGDDGYSHSFCSLSKKELIQKYGSSKFDTTENILEDFFDLRDTIREEKLTEILNG